ncbi:hypothetical protein TYRP_010580 [Tyrophagus putrescentiae]|nr:hypothetical protein TYRP_010580 [Tyrophagus putrescentiae]
MLMLLALSLALLYLSSDAAEDRGRPGRSAPLQRHMEIQLRSDRVEVAAPSKSASAGGTLGSGTKNKRRRSVIKLVDI